MGAELLSSLPELAFTFALVLCRTGTVVMLLPGLGEADPPAIVRAGLALAITFLLLPSVAPLVPHTAEGGTGIVMLGGELITGAVLGWLARLPVLALTMAGAVISYFLGLSSVVQPDPALGGQSTALARMFALLAPVLILATGLYHLPLEALAGSYTLVMPGGALPAGGVAELMVHAASDSLRLALQLSAPFLIAGMIWQVVLGLVARVVPQFQVYTAAAPGQLLGGMVLLGVLATQLTQAWSSALSVHWAGLLGL